MLRFDRLEVRLGDFLLGADFAVAPASVTAVIGPSGSGKSTLLAAAAGFLAPTSGAVRYEERDLNGVAPGRRPMSTLFQDGNLFPHLDIATNIVLGRDPSGRMTPELLGEVDALLDRLGMADLGARMPRELSGGQQGRAALARALLRDRPVVLLDEPFAALGPALRHEMLDLVAEVFAERTVLMITHDPEDARRVASETVFLDDGRAAPPVATPALFEAPPEGLKAYLG